MQHKILFILILFCVLARCSTSNDGDREKEQVVVIETEFGDMLAVLFDKTPLHKKNFLELARSSKYDNTIWHRVIKGFMIQGGDIYDSGQEPEEARIPAEIQSGLYHIKGALAAARQGDQMNPTKKSSSCQFYIVQGQSYEMMTTDLNQLNTAFGEMVNSDPIKYQLTIENYRNAAGSGQKAAIEYLLSIRDDIEGYAAKNFYKPLLKEADSVYKRSGSGADFLDGEYTVFGQVIDGIQVIDKIAAVETGSGDKPINDISMKVSVKSMGRDQIREQYGYEFP